MRTHLIIYMALAAIGMASCSQESTPVSGDDDNKGMPMRFQMSLPGAKTRATATDFETGDKSGVYVTQADKPLQLGGNVVNNEPLTYNGKEWQAANNLYWDEGTYNIYASYPYISGVSSIEDQPFSVSLNQNTEKTSTSLGGYEASDLLYASSKNVAASAEPVSLTYSHLMSKLTIRLVKGEDFEGEMPANATVYVHNTVTEATIDLQAGVATRSMKASRQTITAHNDGDYVYSAIIVPQRIDNRMPLIEVVMNNMSYLYESKFQFKPGMEHLVNLIIPNNPDNIQIEISGNVKDWQ